jgi:hypothetical protein
MWPPSARATGRSKNFYGSVLDHDNVKADMATVKVEHDFANGAKLVNTSRYGKTKQDYLLTSFMATNANLPTLPTRIRTLDHGAPNLTTKDQLNEILTNQTTLTADFTTGAHQAHRGRRPGTDQREADQLRRRAGHGTTLPATSIYQPERRRSDRRQLRPQRRPHPGPPTPRACTCLTPSSSASSGSSTAACVWTTTIFTTPIAVTTGVATNLTTSDNLSTANCRRCTSQPRTAACTRWWPRRKRRQAAPTSA